MNKIHSPLEDWYFLFGKTELKIELFLFTRGLIQKWKILIGIK